MTERIAAGMCEQCGKNSEELRYIHMAGDMFVFLPGYASYGIWICPECKKKNEERIKKRYRTAGEHTEPAE